MDRLINIQRNNPDKFYRYKMQPIQTKIEGKGNGIKTVVVNLSTVAQQLSRPGSHLIKYFGFELGAQTNLDPSDDRWIINGAHEASKLQDLLDGFIERFILCADCGNPETDLHIKDKKHIERDCKACGATTIVEPQWKLNGFLLKSVPKKTKKDKAERRAARIAKQNGAKPTEENGIKPTDENGASSGEDGSDLQATPDGEDKKTEIVSDDDAFTRKIKSEAQVINTNAQEVNDDDWAVDMSEEAVRARQQQLPGEFKQKLVLNGDDDDEEGEGGNTVYNQLGSWIQEQATDKGGIDKVDDVDIYKKAMELGIATKHRTVVVLVQTIFDENVITQIPKRASMLKSMVSSEKHEKALLGGTERLLSHLSKDTPDIFTKTAKILQLYYAEGLASEEFIIKWGARASKKYVDPPTNKKIRKAAEPLIKWLQEAEEESDDE